MDEQTSFERGLMAYVRGDLEVASEELRSALAAEPTDLRVYDLIVAIGRESNSTESTASRMEAPQQPSMQSPLTAERILRIVETRNPEIRSKVHKIIEARSRLREANFSISPELSILTRIYPLGLFATLSQNLYGGYLKRKAMMSEAEQMLVESVADYVVTREQVLSRALTTYIDITEATITEKEVAGWSGLQKERLRIATAQARFDEALPDEIMREQADLLEFDSERQNVRSRQTGSRIVLNTMMGLSDGFPLKLSTEEIRTDVSESVYKTVQIARERRYELKQAQARIAEARADKQNVRTGMPDVDVRASYGLRDRDTTDSFQRGGSVAAIMRIPVMFLPLKAAQMDRQEAIVRQLELDQQAMISRMAEDVVEAHHDYLEALAVSKVTEKRAQTAAETLRVADVSDRWAGNVMPDALLDKKIEWLRATTAAIRSRFELQRKVVELHHAMGLNIKDLAAGSGAFERQSVANVFAHNRAIYVWRTSSWLEPRRQALMLDSVRSSGIGTLFLSYSRDLLARQPDLRQLIREAKTRGMRVHAVGGEPNWILPEKADSVERFIDAVLVHNQGSETAAQFDAIHLDIEPYADSSDVRAATGNPGAQLAGYLSLLEHIRARTADRIPLFAAIPLKYATAKTPNGDAIHQIVANVDGVVLMNYRKELTRAVDTSGAILAMIPPELGHGKVWLGTSADSDHLCSDERAFVDKAVMQLEESFESDPRFAGVAIHDLDRYTALPHERDRNRMRPECEPASQEAITRSQNALLDSYQSTPSYVLLAPGYPELEEVVTSDRRPLEVVNAN